MHPCFFSFQKHRFQILSTAHFLKNIMYTVPNFCCAYLYGTVANSLNLIKPLGGSKLCWYIQYEEYRVFTGYIQYEEYPVFTVCCMMMFIVLYRSVLVLLCLQKYTRLSTSTLLAHEELESKRSQQPQVTLLISINQNNCIHYIGVSVEISSSVSYSSTITLRGPSKKLVLALTQVYKQVHF